MNKIFRILEKWFSRHFSKGFLTRIDIVILLCIIMLLMGIGAAVKLVLQKDTYVTVELLASGGEWWWGVPPPYYWNARDIAIGAKEYNSFQKLTAEVTDVVKYGEDDRKFMWMKARLLVTQNLLTKTYTFKQEALQIGKTIHLAPNNVALIGQVVGIEGVGSAWNSGYIDVEGVALAVHPWIADAIVVGDKVLDNNGQLVAQVQDVHIENADVMTTTWTGETLHRKNPLLRDVTIKMKMRIMQDGEMKYFNFNQPVETGNRVRVQFPKYAVEVDIKSVAPSN